MHDENANTAAPGASHEYQKGDATVSLPSPSLGRIVLVRTWGEPINGQEEHAAIVTQVWSPTCINLMIMPGNGVPYPKTSVMHESTLGPEVGQGAVSWRWPPRV